MLQRRALTLSYRIPIIWGTVIAIALVGLVAGWLSGRGVQPPAWSQDLPAASATDGEAEPGMSDRLARTATDAEAMLGLALWLQQHADGRDRAIALEAWPNDPEADPILEAICRTLIAHWGPKPPPTLLILADSEPPPRWTNRALADFHAQHDRPEAALARYVREGGQHPAATSSRHQAVTLATELAAFDRLATWSADPIWADAFDAHTRFEIATASGDWPGVLEWLLPTMYANFDPVLAIVAAVAALVYLFFLWHSSYGLPRRAELGALCLAGFALGVVSTWLTILGIVLEERLGFGEGDTAFEQAVYAILGIGLREESAKLLCFLPLVPVLVRRHGPLAWLLVASCVGAGFAAEENLGYYQQSLGGAVTGRFLTANFLHLALTGLAGLAVCQAVRWPREMGAHAAAMFCMVVIAHGLYDAFLIVGALESFAWAYLIVFVLAGNAYFAALHQERSGPRPALSLTMVFCAGLTLVLAVAFVVLSTQYGTRSAATLLFPGLLASGIVVIMFVRGIGDRLSA